jgi:hypothetical protein
MSQRDLFWNDRPDGATRRDRALKKFLDAEAPWIERARAAMVQMGLDGWQEFSSDDVWRFCPPPADCHPSVMGTIFKSSLFIMTGWKASTRPSAHARVIRTYRLRGDEDGR